jgi:hypothetical protein
LYFQGMITDPGPIRLQKLPYYQPVTWDYRLISILFAGKVSVARHLRDWS